MLMAWHDIKMPDLISNKNDAQDIRFNNEGNKNCLEIEYADNMPI